MKYYRHIAILALFLALLICPLAHAATRTATSTTAGLWSEAGSWDTGVPVDGDSFVIPAGKSITFDVDQSAMGTGMAASSIAGELYVTQTPGTYTLKLAGTLSGAGVLNFYGATSATDLADNVILNITSTYNGSLVTMTGALNIRCTEPAVPVATLKEGYAIGVTKIYVNETLDTVWANGRYLRVDETGTLESEERTIVNTGVDGGGQYITLSAGLTAAKDINATVTLTERNIQFTGNNGSAQYRFNGVHDSYVKAGFRNFNRGWTSCYSNTVSSGSWSGNTYGWIYCYSNTVSGGSWSGNTYGWNFCYSNTVSGGSWSGNTYSWYTCYSNTVSGGSWSGNSRGWNSCYSNTVSSGSWSGNAQGWISCYSNTVSGGSWSGNTQGWYTCHSNTVYDSTFSNTYDLYRSQGLFDDCTFTGGTRYYQCTALYQALNTYSQATNDGGAGDFSARTCGGTTTNSAVDPPTGHTESYLHTCEDADVPCFRQTEYELAQYQRITFSIHSKCSADFTIDPKVEILDAFQDPLVSGSALSTVTIDDSDTDWHADTISYLNNAATPTKVMLRVTAQDAAKLLYERADPIVPSFVGR